MIDPKIGVVGEALIDLEVAQGDARHPIAHPGGSPMNVAVTLGRLGSEDAFFGRLSSDAFGKLLRTHLAESNVDLRWIVDAAEPTSLAIVSVSPNGSASYAFHVEGTADWQWQSVELPKESRAWTRCTPGRSRSRSIPAARWWSGGSRG